MLPPFNPHCAGVCEISTASVGANAPFPLRDDKADFMSLGPVEFFLHRSTIWKETTFFVSAASVVHGGQG